MKATMTRLRADRTCHQKGQKRVVPLWALVLGCVLGGAPVLSLAQSGSTQAALDSLIKAAKVEGEVLFYSSATENVVKRTGDAFNAKYGIRYSFIRLPGATANLQRFATEAESGTFAADFFFNAGGTLIFARDAAKRGWVEPVSQAGIPAVLSGEFPARFLTEASAIVQILPWSIMYNTNNLRPGDIPRTWLDLLEPRFKGQILLADPKSADSHLDLWALILDKHGEDFFTKLRAMGPRYYSNAIPAANGLAAGEGLVQLPAVGPAMQSLKGKGAPVDVSTPEHTTGVEMQIVLTHRSKARRPNAARLFANYVMTPEGSKVFNADPGAVSVFDTTRLPKQYEPTKPATITRKDLIVKLVGAQ